MVVGGLLSFVLVENVFLQVTFFHKNVISRRWFLVFGWMVAAGGGRGGGRCLVIVGGGV